MIVCISRWGLRLRLRITMRHSTPDNKIVILHPATSWEWYLVTCPTAIRPDFTVDSFCSHSVMISANRLIWFDWNYILCPSGAHQNVTRRAIEHYTRAESDLPGRIGSAVIGRRSVVDNASSRSGCTIAKCNRIDTISNRFGGHSLFIQTTRSAAGCTSQRYQQWRLG